MQIDYATYLDKVLGGWIGKSMGGAVGARFEGVKRWIEIDPAEMIPKEMPPNDDLDLQVLWLHVLEQKGAAITSDDMAQAWEDLCWYPFNEYGIFRRNWKLGIHPPLSGKYCNQFWETGEGCPIRAEIWGFVFPGAPDVAAAYARMDGVLDHSEQSVGAEQMFAAMVSMAFFVSDVNRLIEMSIHYLPAGSPIDLLTRAAVSAHKEGLTLREAHQRLMALHGNPEACDAQINVPFTILALLYGDNDLQKTMLSALCLGYDTDCTLGNAAALLGQIMGAKKIPATLKEQTGDELVMAIQYRRPEMTISALARDTCRVGVAVSRDAGTGTVITNAPSDITKPIAPYRNLPTIHVEYDGLPAAAPGETVRVCVHVTGAFEGNGTLTITPPPHWEVVPSSAPLDAVQRCAAFCLTASSDVKTWPKRHLFDAQLRGGNLKSPLNYQFGVAGTELYRFLGVYYSALAREGTLDAVTGARTFNQHFVYLDEPYLDEAKIDPEAEYKRWSRLLGRRAVVASREHEIDWEQLTGLEGPCCVYLSRRMEVKEAQNAFLVIGNTDGFKVWLNGELVGERDECTVWTPFNCYYKVKLKAGMNDIRLKLLRRTGAYRFTLGFRGEDNTYRVGQMNACDWMVDVADEAPGA